MQFLPDMPGPGSASMRYVTAHYMDLFCWLSRKILYFLTSYQFAFGILFAGFFVQGTLQFLMVDQNIINAAVLPCLMFFIWAFLISFIDFNIERDEL
jgi:hypothetical protein